MACRIIWSRGWSMAMHLIKLLLNFNSCSTLTSAAERAGSSSSYRKWVHQMEWISRGFIFQRDFKWFEDTGEHHDVRNIFLEAEKDDAGGSGLSLSRCPPLGRILWLTTRWTKLRLKEMRDEVVAFITGVAFRPKTTDKKWVYPVLKHL